MSAQQVIDAYLDLMEQLIPEERAKVEYVVVDIRSYGLCTLRTNSNMFWEAQIDAVTGELVWPQVVGVNGEWDAATGEWISWN